MNCSEEGDSLDESLNLKTVDKFNWVWFDWSCISWEICHLWPFKAKARKEFLRLVLLQALMEFIDTEVAMSFLLYGDVHLSKTDYQKWKKNCAVETWFCAWLADWMLRCGRGTQKWRQMNMILQGRGLWLQSCIHHFHRKIELLHSD